MLYNNKHVYVLQHKILSHFIIVNTNRKLKQCNGIEGIDTLDIKYTL